MANTPVSAQEGEWAMCFSEPGRVRSIDGSMVRVETADGVFDASLRVIAAGGRAIAIGDWVLMSLGLVVEVVDECEGRALLDQMRALRQEVEP
jgi:hydrogenase assembly chaperone HypC/HupF